MAEPRPLPDNSVHSRFLDHAADRGKQGGLYLNSIPEKYSFHCGAQRRVLQSAQLTGWHQKCT